MEAPFGNWRPLKGSDSLHSCQSWIIYQCLEDYQWHQLHIQRLPLALKELKQNLAKKEAQLLEPGDAYADFEQHLQQLTTQRNNISRDVAQVVALEVELEQIKTAMVEQVNPLQEDFL